MHLKIKFNANSELLAPAYKDRQNHDDDSGFDLITPNEVAVPYGTSSATINFNISVAAYDDTGNNVPFFLIPRSSISKTPIRMANSIGLIDKGYRGNLMAKVDNLVIDDNGYGLPYNIPELSRLFQIVSFDGSPITCEFVDELDETTRGEGGFGSTGGTVN